MEIKLRASRWSVFFYIVWTKLQVGAMLNRPDCVQFWTWVLCSNNVYFFSFHDSYHVICNLHTVWTLEHGVRVESVERPVHAACGKGARYPIRPAVWNKAGPRDGGRTVEQTVVQRRCSSTETPALYLKSASHFFEQWSGTFCEQWSEECDASYISKTGRNLCVPIYDNMNMYLRYSCYYNSRWYLP